MNKTSAAIVRTILLGTSCLSALGLVTSVAKADPTGGVVISGSATIGGTANNTVINQTTNKALINWQDFSIALGGSVKFNQPGSSSITVNRVIGNLPSNIQGNLLANGQVWILNGNGILFGRGATVNVGGLIATTSDIATRDFENGTYNFSGGTGASVVNQGTIRARTGGSVVLSGASVQNQGLIAAQTGTVVLGGASAFTVDFVGDGLIKYAITGPAQKADNGETGVSNSGTINANNGGTVIMTARAAANVADAVVNNTGMISATSARNENGEVILDAGDNGTVNMSGSIDVSGVRQAATGGTVSITGHDVNVNDGARINANGEGGGGTVLIGGDAHGKGTLANATNTHVGAAIVTADATRRGDGGKLVVWSNGLTDFSGIFSAMGGAMGGNGGFVETSGHTLRIADTAQVSTLAPMGKTGNWLLDPDNIVIQTGGADGLPQDLGTNPGGTSTVAPSTLISALASTDVTLEAANNITVSDAVIYSSSHSLSLLSGGDINIHASILNTQAVGGGSINLVAGWDGVTTDPAHFFDPGVYGGGEGGAQITLITGEGSGPIAVGTRSGTTNVATGVLYIQGSAGYAQLGYHDIGGGDIFVRANYLSVTAYASDAMLGNGSLLNDNTGNATGNIDVDVNAFSINQVGEGGGTAWLGNNGGGSFKQSGNLTFVAGEGNVNGGVDFADFILKALGDGEAASVGGDVTIGNRSDAGIDDLIYNSSHTLNLLATGNFEVAGIVQNNGSGNVNLIAGWDGHTLDPAHFKDAGAYGNNNGSVFIGGEFIGDAAVGSKSGNTFVAGYDIVLSADNGPAQIGYMGAGTGDITVLARNDIYLNGSYDTPENYVLIGNGSLSTTFSGTASGNIFVQAGGTLVMSSFAGCGCTLDPSPIMIGNMTPDGQGGVTAKGDVALFVGDIDDQDDEWGGLIESVRTDLGGGNVTLGFTNSANPLVMVDYVFANSPNNLTILAAGDLTIAAPVSNSGTGAITLVGGWNGDTDLSHLNNAGFWGNRGTLTIGGSLAAGAAYVGTRVGATNVYADNVNLDPINGFAQIGFHGPQGGDINVRAAGEVRVVGGSTTANFSQLGNGSVLGVGSGDVTGNIFIDAYRVLGFDGSAGQGWIGNAAASGFKSSGSVTMVAVEGFVAADFLISDLGSSSVPGSGGDVFLGFHDNQNLGLYTIGGLVFDSPHNFIFATAGSGAAVGNVQNAGTGAVTLVAGWDGTIYNNAADFIANNAYGLNNATFTVGGTSQFQSAAVGSAGGTTNILSYNVTVAPKGGSGYYAQIGYHGNAGGNIFVTTKNDLTLQTGTAGTETAHIGNGILPAAGAVTGNVTGNIFLDIGGASFLHSTPGGALVWVGNRAGGSFTATGNLVWLSDYIDGDEPVTPNLAADLAGGDVTIGFRNVNATISVENGFSVNSTHTLNLLSVGGIEILSNLQNQGTGAINLIGGWDGTTLDAAHFGDAGVFGNNSGFVTIGGANASGFAAIGTRGNMFVAAHNVDVTAVNASAQLGFVGSGSGAITIKAVNSVAVSSDSANFAAQLGNGAFNLTNDAGGDISITAGSVNVSTAQNNSSARIGNGGANGHGNFGGNITINATGGVVANAAGTNSTVQIGNGGFQSVGNMSGSIAITAGQLAVNANATNTSARVGNGGPGFKGNASGSITVNTTGDVSLLTSSSNTGAAIGNGGDNSNLNPTAGASYLGDILINAHNVNLTTNSANSNTRIGNGGVNAASAGANTAVTGNFVFGGNVTVNAANSVSIYSLGVAQIGNGGFGALANLAITGSSSVGGTVTVTTQSGGADLYGGANSAVRIGNGASGAGTTATGGFTVGGDINLDVAVLGVVADGTNAQVQVGNGSGNANGTVAGAITVNVDGNAIFTDTPANSFAFMGHAGPNGTIGGSATLTTATGDISGLGTSVAAVLEGGSFLVKSGGDVVVSGYDAAYNNANALTILAKGYVIINSAIQNAGSGAITLIAGWDGTTTAPGSLTNAGVYGNFDEFGVAGTVLVYALNGTGVAVGSKSGVTTIAGYDVQLSTANGSPYAQIGYHGGGASGAINLFAVNQVNMLLVGGESGDHQIGNGGTGVTGDVSGAITIHADSIRFDSGGNTGLSAQIGNGGHNFTGNASGNVAVFANNVTIGNGSANVWAQLGNGGLNFNGAATGAIGIDTHSLTLTSGGQGHAMLGHAGGSGASANGAITVNTHGGNLTLSASGTNSHAHLGNWTQGTTSGATGGDITLDAGAVSISAAGSNTYAQIGNGTFRFTSQTGAVSGNILINAASFFASALTSGAQARIGNMGIGAVGGNVTLNTTGNYVQSATNAGLINIGSAFGGTDGNGNPIQGTTTGNLTIASGGSILVTATGGGVSRIQTGSGSGGTVSVTAAGDVTLQTNGSGSGSVALIGTLIGGNGGNNILVTSTNGSVNLQAGEAGSNVSIGNRENGSLGGALGGNVTVTANNATTGNVVLTTATGAQARIGNVGNGVASATGNVSVTAGHNIAISTGNAIIGNSNGSGAFSGSVTIRGASVSGVEQSIENDLAGSDVTVQSTGTGALILNRAVAANGGGALQLLARGNIVIANTIQNAGSGVINAIAGWDGTTTTPASFFNAGVFGNNSGAVILNGNAANASLGTKNGATNVAGAAVNVLAGTGGYAQLGYHGSGGGTIRVAATGGLTLTGLNATSFAMLGNGSLGNDVTGNQTGNIDVRVGGDLTMNGTASTVWFSNLAHSGTLTGSVLLIANDISGTAQDATGAMVGSALNGGDVTLGFTGTGDQGPDQNVSYNSSHTLNLLAAGNVGFAGSVQNAGTGAINIVAGWDKTTLAPASFGNAGVSGNNGKGVFIGTSGAGGNVALGSAGGTTSIYGASLTMAAVNGYAQLGYHGAGSGAILVKVANGVTLTGGTAAGQFVQIGNGGFQVNGNNSGDISITAGGDFALNGGAGANTYVQVGHGGAESNTGSNGYSNTGAITVAAMNVLLNSGAGTGAYTMLGNGGLKAGMNLAGGQGNNGGNITVTSGHDVKLTGNGADAFAQIGNGGSQVNLNPAAAAGGTISGTIVVTAPNGDAGAVTMMAGSGANSYAMIGNGGYNMNGGPTATVANFTVTGDVTVTDLLLQGGNTGGNSFAVIGSGDASKNGYGNVNSNIVINVNGGTITYNQGTAANSPATIGNFTGHGTVTGTLTGATPPSQVNNDPAVIGVVATNTASTQQPANTTVITTVVITDQKENNAGAAGVSAEVEHTPGPLASLDNSGDSAAPNTSDSATVVIADSLDGASKPSGSTTILPGVLKQAGPNGSGGALHGIPPADQNFSSWGNEALWQ